MATATLSSILDVTDVLLGISALMLAEANLQPRFLHHGSMSDSLEGEMININGHGNTNRSYVRLSMCITSMMLYVDLVFRPCNERTQQE